MPERPLAENKNILSRTRTALLLGGAAVGLSVVLTGCSPGEALGIDSGAYRGAAVQVEGFRDAQPGSLTHHNNQPYHYVELEQCAPDVAAAKNGTVVPAAESHVDARVGAVGPDCKTVEVEYNPDETQLSVGQEFVPAGQPGEPIPKNVSPFDYPH